MLAMPFSATEVPNEGPLSSMRQPVTSMAEALVFVTSNQSASTVPAGVLPEDHGATSEMMMPLAAAIRSAPRGHSSETPVASVSSAMAGA
jgi:hypothetical protein